MSRQVLEYGRKVAMEYWLEGGPKSETLDKNFWKKLGQNAELPVSQCTRYNVPRSTFACVSEAPQKGADPKTCYEAYCNVVRETYKVCFPLQHFPLFQLSFVLVSQPYPLKATCCCFFYSPILDQVCLVVSQLWMRWRWRGYCLGWDRC